MRFPFFWLVCVGFPISCIAYEQRQFPEFSLDSDDFEASLPLLVWFTTIATILLVSLGLAFNTFNYDGKFATRVAEYIFWAFLQQIGLQTFLTRRVHQVYPNPYVAAAISSTLFALFHVPNPTLVIFSWVGGFFWSLSYIGAPNLYLIALSHGWLAVLALHCVPPAWLHGLRIGPSYWLFKG